MGFSCSGFAESLAEVNGGLAAGVSLLLGYTYCQCYWLQSIPGASDWNSS